MGKQACTYAGLVPRLLSGMSQPASRSRSRPLLSAWPIGVGQADKCILDRFDDIVHEIILTGKYMTAKSKLLRMDNVGIVVDDLKACCCVLCRTWSGAGG